MRNKLCGYSLFIYRMLAVTSFLCSSDSLIRLESLDRTFASVTQASRISIPVLSSSLTDFSVRPQKIQILVALVQCIPLSEKLCNYCDIFYLIYFLLKCIACDSETLDYFITVIDFQLL